MMHSTDALSIPESYWVEPGRFLAGEYPGHPNLVLAEQRINALLDIGIDTFFDLTREGELDPYDSLLNVKARNYPTSMVTYHRFPISDYGLPEKVQMKEILDFIDTSLAVKRKVYLHCWGGVGRTGTVVGCYLVRQGQTGTQALCRLASWWQSVPKQIHYPRTPETDAQVQFILDWQD